MTVQIDQRFAAFRGIYDNAVFILDLVVDGYNALFSNVHRGLLLEAAAYLIATREFTAWGTGGTGRWRMHRAGIADPATDLSLRRLE
ncbi:hypothetical protein GCM10007392_46010 [Saccharospirillum salsuginis]|uniref:Uncharacterized protein n=1 Tax=Saccharospirillum salsuginis TaxID=418750 RepID=A0A918KRR6_9GAMM|nr:hypothetical protein GCM10007392_46010 [Saccharospirillum salsuginis]